MGVSTFCFLRRPTLNGDKKEDEVKHTRFFFHQPQSGPRSDRGLVSPLPPGESSGCRDREADEYFRVEEWT